MKLWLAVCAGLSTLLLAALLCSMMSCCTNYGIDPQGRLVRVPETQTDSTPAKKVEPPLASWDRDLPEFRRVAGQLRPGDRLTHTRYETGFPLFKLEMTKLQVICDGATLLVVRDGHLRFWSVIAGISLLPLLFWAGGAWWAVSSRPRPPPA